MRGGYIKLYRSIASNWINEPQRPRTYREAWEDILLSANWQETKVSIRGELLDCHPGQSLNSVSTWANRFGWSVDKVRHFFKLLKQDGSITIEGLKSTTRLTVCKWDIYQGEAPNSTRTEPSIYTEPDEENTPILNCCKSEDSDTIAPNSTRTEPELKPSPAPTNKEIKNLRKIGTTQFSPPQLSEITQYFIDFIKIRNNPLDPILEAELFEAFYASNGWKVGGNSMRDWKKAASGWLLRASRQSKSKNIKQMEVQGW